VEAGDGRIEPIDGRVSPTLLLALKLAGVGLVVTAASLVARRHGHRAGGLLAGLPLIAGPVMGLLLLTQPAAWVQQLAVATLACLPATVAHQVAFAWASRRLGVVGSLLAANVAFVAAGAGLVLLAPGPGWAGLGALDALWGGRRALPRVDDANASGVGAARRVSRVRPGQDLAVRVAAAVGLAAVLLLTADQVPPAYGGWLLALPITGNVLPAFALAQGGPMAAIALLRGFLIGLGAFFGFFAVLAVLLAIMPAVAGAWSAAGATAAAFAAAVAGAPLVGWLLARR
jgi:hypothetical protein